MQEFFIGAYINKAFDLNLFILNKDGGIVTQNKSVSMWLLVISSSWISATIKTCFTSLQNRNIKAHFNVRSNDESLKQKFKMNSRIKFLNSFDDHAFIRVQKGGHISLSEYSSNFDLIQEFGKGSNSKCRFFSQVTSTIFLSAIDFL